MEQAQLSEWLRLRQVAKDWLTSRREYEKVGIEIGFSPWEELAKKRSRIAARGKYWIEGSMYSFSFFLFIFLNEKKDLSPFVVYEEGDSRKEDGAKSWKTQEGIK